MEDINSKEEITIQELDEITLKAEIVSLKAKTYWMGRMGWITKIS